MRREDIEGMRYEQVAKWCNEGMYQKVIEALEGVPRADLDPNMALRLALAYNNTDRLQDSIDLLAVFQEDGEGNAVWNYYMGYALLFSERKEEARPYLLRARGLDPRVPAEGLLHYCICYDGGPDEGVGADDVVGWMREMLGGVMDGGRISVPDIGAWVSVYPQLRAEGICAAILHMDIGLPSGESFYECSVGTGDDFRRAATTAIGSFYMGFYKGLRRMLSGAPVAEAVDSRSRRWNVFASDLVGIGDHPRVPDGFYWGLLGQAVPDHLGGRGVAYMKVYGARSAGTVTAECRVDDVVSGALSGILAGHVSEWGGDGFASHKQFFFLARAEPGDTYPYSQGQIDGYVSAAAEMYAHTEYDEVFPALRRLTGDACLADELHGFVPELCAHRAFDKVVMPERFSISADGRTEEYTRWQVTSYNMIEKAVGAWLDGGPAQEAFQWCVSVSALYGGVIKAKEGGTDVTEEGGEIKLSLDYNFHDGYVAR